jgi:hypothetical protein
MRATQLSSSSIAESFFRADQRASFKGGHIAGLGHCLILNCPHDLSAMFRVESSPRRLA